MQDSLRACRTKFDQALHAADTALASEPQFREIARIEAKNGFHEHVAAIFDEDFESIVSSSGLSVDKLPRLTAAFALQRDAYLAVFTDFANKEVCRQESVNALQKAFRAVFVQPQCNL